MNLGNGRETQLQVGENLSQITWPVNNKYTNNIQQTQNICITFIQLEPTSKTLIQCCINVIQMFCGCWDARVRRAVCD